MFNQCQRKWLYYEVIASATSNDPIRKEAHLLKQLQSVSAWRGSLVDTVIDEKISPQLRNNALPDKNEIISFADELFECQLQFGKENRYRNEGMSKSQVGNKYCAFRDIEYNGRLNENKIETAKVEVRKSLSVLLDSNLIQQIAENNEHILSQRSLRFSLEGVQVTSTPDMVVFFEKQPPLIIDWKVHSFGNSDAWLQLGIYSLTLSRVNPHKDFPESFNNHLNKPESFQLLEFQLLKNVQRKYSLNPEDILDIEDYIFRSSSQMEKLLNGKKVDELDFSIFKTARRPQMCGRCQFKKLCWAEQQEKSLGPIQQTLFGVFN